MFDHNGVYNAFKIT